jgi:hypothetical protein
VVKVVVAMLLAGCAAGAAGEVGSHGATGGMIYGSYGHDQLQFTADVDVTEVASERAAILDAGARTSIPSWIASGGHVAPLEHPWLGRRVDLGLDAGVGGGLREDGGFARVWGGAWLEVRFAGDDLLYPALHVGIRYDDEVRLGSTVFVVFGLSYVLHPPPPSQRAI